ncbi:ATP-binding protein [Amycolatopsis antarctica]|uniref:ATP-binding protein n=1 Tax=Amycolatopsis antarctica TaxID=1854586 RepID=A0A263CYX0_9PSEU|nr:ATP-binding protein [Amycolatopsis antarctica]OZM71159.1 ATP-binding protein [Amycolatopsis antarctica]
MRSEELATSRQAEEAGELPIHTDRDLLSARHAVRTAAVAEGFDLIGQTKLVTAASELVRNAYIHGNGGGLTILPLTGPGGRRGLRLIVRDDGPGIPDLDAALADGFTTGTGLGHGLGGTRRLVDEFDIDSTERGTTVVVTRWTT